MLNKKLCPGSFGKMDFLIEAKSRNLGGGLLSQSINFLVNISVNVKIQIKPEKLAKFIHTINFLYFSWLFNSEKNKELIKICA